MSAPAASIPATGTWRIDGVHSAATFRVTHNEVATFHGSFAGIRGELAEGVLSGEVDVETINIGVLEAFKQALLSADWFDAANHPTLAFRSTELHSHEDGEVHGAGEITIKGITKPVAFAGTVIGPREVRTVDGSISQRLGLNLTSTFDRRQFGLEAWSGTDWIVTLEVALEMVAAPAE